MTVSLRRVVFLGVALAASSVWATTYFADPVNGDDSNTGLVTTNADTQVVTTNAFKTFTKLFSKHANDVELVLLPGEYEVEARQTIINWRHAWTLRGSTGNPADVIVKGGGTNGLFTTQGGCDVSNILFKAISFKDFSMSTDSGGALYLSGNHDGFIHVTIDSCKFENCTSKNYGGAVYFQGTDLVVTNCTFVRCAAGGRGGAVYCNTRRIAGWPLVSFYDCQFEENCATNNGYGGAVSIANAYVPGPRMLNCKFLRNYALRQEPISTNDKNNFYANGGALNGAIERMSDCDFIGNYGITTYPAWTNCAGGAWSFGSVTTFTSCVERCRFLTNICHGVGGAIYGAGDYKKSTGATSFKDCLFEGNSATGDGAVFYHGYTGNGMTLFEMEGCVIRGNRTSRTGKCVKTAGQGLANCNEVIELYVTDARIRRCRFEGNVGCGRASALTIYNRGNNGTCFRGVDIEDCIFSDNVILRPDVDRRTDPAGVLGLWGEVAMSNVVVRNCLFTHNINSNSLGGAIYVFDNNCLPGSAIENCTFVGNTAWSDAEPTSTTAPFGGIDYRDNSANMADMKIRNCLFAGNHREGDPEMVRDFDYYAKAAITNCFFATEATGAQASRTMKDKEQGCIVGYDPKFVDPAHGDYRIRRVSKARDRGIDQPWMTEPGAHDLLVTNEFGKVSSRVVGEHVDIGCYEWRQTDGLLLFVR